jgi:hypothetical protein
MKWLSLVFSFLLGKFNTPHRPSLKETAFEVIEEATFKSRIPLALLLGALSCVLLLCGGFFMGLIDLTQQYDREGVVRFTASFGSGLALLLIGVGIFSYIFIYAWPGARKHSVEQKLKEQEAKTANSSLEQALATLVLDFVKEREQKREQVQYPVPTAAAEKENPILYN